MTVDISSLVDGEIEADEASALVARVGGNPEQERVWELNFPQISARN